MSLIDEDKRKVQAIATENGHTLGQWHYVMGTATLVASCTQCNACGNVSEDNEPFITSELERWCGSSSPAA